MDRQFGIAAALLVTGLCLPAAAGAQHNSAITISAGVISGDDAAPSADFGRPVYAFSMQRVFKRHFVIEGEVSHWTLLRKIEHGRHDITGPQGRLGRVTGTTIEDSHNFWNVGANFLVKSTGRVRVFGGAGAGLSTDANVYSQQSFGCSPSLDPRTCERRFENRTSRGPVLLVRGVGGLEVPVASRFDLFGTVRVEKTAWEDRRDWLGATAGLRVSFD